MHCDSLIGAEAGEGESGDGPIVHEPPRRVLIRLPGTQEQNTNIFIIYNYFTGKEIQKLTKNN